MPLITSLSVLPLYAQVSILDPSARDIPQWGTGDEVVVASAECISVATRADFEGDVFIEVWHKQLAAGEDAGKAIFDGTLELTEQNAVVGNIVLNELQPVELGAGRHRIRIFSLPKGERPSKVIFLVD
jgi:hypothetical protein